MKVFFFIDTLHQGGAARLLTLIANGLSERGYDVLIGTNISNEIAYKVDSRIRIRSIYPDDISSISKSRRFIIHRKKIRELVKKEKPNVLITVIPSISFIVKVSTMDMGIPTVFCDVTSYARKDSKWYHFIRYHFYKIGDAVTVQTQNDIDILGERLPRKVLINNPLTYPIVKHEIPKEKVILAVGATKDWHIKGFDLLLESFSLFAAHTPGWKLQIAGATTSESVSFLQCKVSNLNLNGRVEFIGFQKDLRAVMATASIFALPSRIEGFSLSLVEAISQRCACVSYKIHGVITDVTGGGHGAILVEDGDYQSFAKALNELIVNPDKRAKLVQDGQEYIKKYSLPEIVDRWEDLISSLSR